MLHGNSLVDQPDEPRLRLSILPVQTVECDDCGEERDVDGEKIEVEAIEEKYVYGVCLPACSCGSKKIRFER